jgi:hypothetical protein
MVLFFKACSTDRGKVLERQVDPLFFRVETDDLELYFLALSD